MPLLPAGKAGAPPRDYATATYYVQLVAEYRCISSSIVHDTLIGVIYKVSHKR